ncbi:MAG: thioredoxin-like domain-containing protein [Bacteroidota bacterium]|nr:thioredoxin-like domain-containing protein [Bacteroidota bacterium]
MKNILLLLLIYLSTSSAQELSVIKGKLLGYDGKPMAKAHVHLIDPEKAMMYASLSSVEPDTNGNFELKTDLNGLLFIAFTGVNHQLYGTKLLIEEPQTIGVTVKLNTYDYLDDFGSVSIIGDFNDFDFQTAQKMEKQSDGTYTAEFETEKEKFSYQLMNITKHPRSLNGTLADEYEYDGGGDYHSVIKVQNGLAKIIFDTTKLIKSEIEPEIKFDEPNSLNAKLSILIEEDQKRQKALQEAYRKHITSGNASDEFNYDWWGEAANLKARAMIEENPILRNVLILNAFRLAPLKNNSDTLLIKQLVNSMKPISALWSLYPWLLNTFAAVALDEVAYNEYITQAINNHPERFVKSIVVFQEIARAYYKEDSSSVKYYYELMMKEFGDTQYARFAKESYSPDKKIIIGRKIPEFSITSLDDSTIIYNNEYFKGKILLIDFWATWCKPCVGEMEHLHNAYEKYKDRNFDILSISFDAKLEDVIKFRNGKWKMPWHNSFVSGSFKNELAQKFEVIGIPKPILIDESGKIIAVENKLRGKALEKTLSETLNKPK